MPKKARKKLISVLIPVFNEEDNVRLAYDAIREVFDGLRDRYDLEILFSDNHSSDGTFGELRKIAADDPRVRIIRLARNFGFQRSVLTGYRNVSGDAAIQIDCDLEDPPELIPAFLEKWEAGHDVVAGVRRKRQENVAMELARRSYYRLVSSISDDNILADAGDFRLVDRSVINRLTQVYDARPYLRGLISSLAARQAGIEYNRTTTRKFGQSKFPLFRLTGLAADGLVSHSLAPLRLASFCGAVIFFASVFVALYYLVAFFVAGAEWPAGFATLVILLLMSVGLNAMFVGIVGEYVGRIYDQVRMRPTAIIEEKINFEEREPVRLVTGKHEEKKVRR